ncbi:MAG: tyrosine--tRNA ligase [Nitrososphaerota archaeon]|jgi:tyrosyl-tRNA synthetase|nr:tyrosine--tRNA ligase [Nitrososphaerota archaeon]MDG6930794.1 tyrosine--tRNA ligase [Nitrososphaerota archaeon]MDG6932956.1 tyrosine--tRNA ligase [Nitrososphaerota archaeon]MDG6936458.1 tyrosine--tRNA ligase [Nitrososphaerota archaeon]MDG6944705.1 tyrosine--tRNA ligase [Nitrososphaerota archaeon]
MTADERLALIMKEPTEEAVTVEELRALLDSGSRIKHYIGIEISGPLHLGSLIVTGIKLRDLVKAGIDVTVFLADWHTYINEKLGKDWELIQELSGMYEMAFTAFIGSQVRFVRGSELYQSKREYWDDLLRLSTHASVQRISRTLTIAGRSEKEELSFAQLFYPVMQVNDIHALGVDLAQGGMDQRKAHMLARDIFPKMGWKPPVALHHHLLPGLIKPVVVGEEEFSKMSKSKPASAVFIHDDFATIKEKLEKAWCPAGIDVGNPVMEIMKYVVFPTFKSIKIERDKKYGGDVEYPGYEELRDAFLSGSLHPVDLKLAAANYIDQLVKPVREMLLSNARYVEIVKNLNSSFIK